MFHPGNEKEDLRWVAVGDREEGLQKGRGLWLVKRNAREAVLARSENISTVTRAFSKKTLPRISLGIPPLYEALVSRPIAFFKLRREKETRGMILPTPIRLFLNP